MKRILFLSCLTTALVAFAAPAKKEKATPSSSGTDKASAPSKGTAPATAEAPQAPAEGVSHARLKVSAAKPLLTERHVIRVEGNTTNGVLGGWKRAHTVTFEAQGEAKGAIRVQIDFTAPADATFTRAFEKFGLDVPVLELKNKWEGEYTLTIVDHEGKSLYEGVWRNGSITPSGA